MVRAPGFAFFGIKSDVVDRVGWFDENFFPAYFDDNEFTRRLRLTGASIADPQGVLVTHVGSATLHSMPMSRQLAFGKRFEELRAYYVSKWGGVPDHETFTTPFDGQPPPGWTERPITKGSWVPEDCWFS